MKGDFLGFSFGGIHSDDLGIVRASGGDRFEEQLHPEINDITAEVSGMDGQYYFGSTYGTKAINLSFAFDSLTETQFRKLRQVFGTKKIKKLIFDECPYKYYLAKCESPIELSYVCFDEPKYSWEKIPIGSFAEDDGDYLLGVSRDEEKNHMPFEYKKYDLNGSTQRIYKGEGKISLVCYFPFAKSEFKALNSTDESADWAVSSGILPVQMYNSKFKDYQIDDLVSVEPMDGNFNVDTELFIEAVTDFGVYEFQCRLNNDQLTWYLNDQLLQDGLSSYGISLSSSYTPQAGDTYVVNYEESGFFNIYNAGDLPTGFRLYCPFTITTGLQLEYKMQNLTEPAYLNISAITPKINITGSKDEGFLINTDNGLIQGVQEIHITQSADTIYTTSGNIYNEYIQSGYFFKLQPNTNPTSVGDIPTDKAILGITNDDGHILTELVGYVLTSDTEVQPNKVYYIKDNNKYIPIDNPSGNPSLQGWYEGDFSIVRNLQIFYDYLYF